MTKHAQDLNINDVFYHNELKPWKVIQQPVITVTTTVEVWAQHTTTKKKKLFRFGRFVNIDIVDNCPVS
jgi:hypothetical protein